MKLAAYALNKDNNFNLIRIIAALAVLFGHSFALLRQSEPMAEILGLSIGSIAVDVFFVTSGFLVTGSLLSRQNLRDYFLARILRIYPALLVMLLLTVFVLGANLSSLGLNAYFSHPQLFFYFHKCLSLVSGAAYYLPGVFEANPYRGAVNGSLWSMVYELYMYFFLALFWLLSSIFKSQAFQFLKWLVVLLTITAFALGFHGYAFSPEINYGIKLFTMFFLGASYWLLREKIWLDSKCLLCAIVILAICATWSIQAFSAVYPFCISYIVFGFAYLPSGAIRHYNRLGDYSYGVYIYAFPIQQSLIALVPDISVFFLTLLATGLTMVCAVLSWVLVERPALDLKKRLTTQASKKDKTLVDRPSLTENTTDFSP